MSRTIEIEIGLDDPPRSMPRTTVVPFGPRIFATASATLPTRFSPSIDTIRSPGRTPALSAGAPWITLETTRVQSGPRVVQDAFVETVVAGIVAPIPLNVPARLSSVVWKSAGLRYWLNGSPRALIIPRIAP